MLSLSLRELNQWSFWRIWEHNRKPQLREWAQRGNLNGWGLWLKTLFPNLPKMELKSRFQSEDASINLVIWYYSDLHGNKVLLISIEIVRCRFICRSIIKQQTQCCKREWFVTLVPCVSREWAISEGGKERSEWHARNYTLSLMLFLWNAIFKNGYAINIQRSVRHSWRTFRNAQTSLWHIALWSTLSANRSLYQLR